MCVRIDAAKASAVPTLCLLGADDQYASVGAFTAWSRALPGPTACVIIKGAADDCCVHGGCHTVHKV